MSSGLKTGNQFILMTDEVTCILYICSAFWLFLWKEVRKIEPVEVVRSFTVPLSHIGAQFQPSPTVPGRPHRPSSPFTIPSCPQPPPARHTHSLLSRRPARLPLGSPGQTTDSRLLPSGTAGNTGSRYAFLLPSKLSRESGLGTLMN